MDAEGTVLNTTTATFFSVAGPHSVPFASRVRRSIATVPTPVDNHSAIVESAYGPTNSLPTLSDSSEDRPGRVSGAPKTACLLSSVDKSKTDDLQTTVPYYVVIGKIWADGWTFEPFWTSLKGPQTDGRIPVEGFVVTGVSE